MKRLGRFAAIGLIAVLGACSTLTHSEERAEVAQQWSQVRGQVKLQLARQQYEGGLFDETIKTVSESLALDPFATEGYVLLSRAYLETGKPASAQRVLDAANEAGLESADLVYTEGVILEQRDQLREALERYAFACELDPANVDYLVAYAECLVSLDRADEALALLDRNANGIDDDDTVAILSAHIAALLGDVEDAARRHQAVAVPDGRHALITEELGLLLARTGRCPESITVLEPLLHSGNGGREVTGTVRRTLAGCYLAAGDHGSAKRILADYARSHPSDVPAQVLLAKAAIAGGDSLTALYAISLAEDHEPDHPEVRLVRATIQWQRGNSAAAAATLYDLLTTSPDDVEAHCLMAEVLLAMDRTAAARDHFEHALRVDPNCLWAIRGLDSARSRG